MEMLERDLQLDRLRSLLADAANGSGRVVLVRGEAGIGKTTLVHSFLTAVADQALVLLGGCDDLTTPREFGPLWDMARVDPALAGALESGDRSRIYGVAFEIIGRDRKPTVLVIEDVHWADAATLDLVKVLGRRIGRSHGLLVVTYRNEELDSDHRLRFVIGDLTPSTVERLALAPLSSEAVAKLAEAHGRDGNFLLAESGGNPLYLSELLRSSEGSVPASVQDATRVRVARLAPATRELIELVSVVPGGAHRSLVEPMGGWSSGVDEAVERGVLLFDGELIAFKHELARRAIEAALPPARRREMNARVLSVMVARSAAPAQIVQHAVEAGDQQAIVEYAPVAAEQATAVQSYSEAVSHYRRLGACLDRFDPIMRAQLLEAWAFASQVEGGAIEALDCARQAVALRRDEAAPNALGRSLRLLSRAAWTAGERDVAEAAAAEAISVLEHGGRPEELAFAHSASAQLDMLAFEFDDAILKADSAIALAREAGADSVLAHAWITKGTALSFADRPIGDQTLADAIPFATTLGAEEEQVRGIVNRAWAALEHRRLPAATTHIDNRIVLLTTLGTVRARRGSGDARMLLDEAWRLALRSGELQRTGYAAAAMAELAWINDEPDRVGPLVLPVLDHARRVGSEWIAGTLAYWAWKAGEISEPPTSIARPSSSQITGDWRVAATEWGELGMPYERALALSEGDTTAKLEALSILDELGADAVAAKLRLQLRSDGVRGVSRGPRRTTRAHRAGLTERQSEVLELVAAGLSNRAIADRLFISPRTVDQHVSAVLAKLAVTSRDEAVAAARDLGVLAAE